MRLNEAIRKGISFRPRQSKGWIDDADGGCVLTAAVEGMVKKKVLYGISSVGFRLELFTHLRTTFTELLDMVLCPECGIPDTCYNVMWHLNDRHNWSREAIAEWIDPCPELHMGMPKVEKELVCQKG